MEKSGDAPADRILVRRIFRCARFHRLFHGERVLSQRFGFRELEQDGRADYAVSDAAVFSGASSGASNSYCTCTPAARLAYATTYSACTIGSRFV
jgi:hypothetical protein